MKNAITEESVQRIYSLLDELIRVDRAQAEKILAEVEQYLKETDFSLNQLHQINMLIGVARFHVNGRDAKKAFRALSEALKIAEDNNIPEEVFHVQSTIAIIYSMRGDHLKAIYLWEDMLAQMEKGSKMWMPIINNLVVAYSCTKQFTRAVDLCFELLQYMDENGCDPNDRVSILINLGNSYTPLKSHEKALKAYQEALSLALKVGNIPYECYVHGNMARTYVDLKEYAKAYEHSRKALEISESYYGEAHLADSLISLASTCIKMQRLDEADALIERGLALLDVDNDQVGYINGLIASATLDLERNLLPEARSKLERAKELCEQGDIMQHREVIYKLFAIHSERAGDYKEAYEYLNKLVDLKDELYEELSDSMISKQEAEYLRVKIEKQNKSLSKKNKELEMSNKMIKKQTRQMEKTNRELQSSLSMLNRLISIISHDVRGPAANSAAALRMVLEGNSSAETTTELIGHVINNLDEVTDLLAEIMVWIESRSFKKDVDRLMKDVSVSSMINPVMKFFRGTLSHKQIVAEVSSEGDKMRCHTEPNIIKIVLRNIISNAIKFSPQGGTIQIQSREIDQFIEIRIVDRGIGMSSREVAQLKKHAVKAKPGTNKEVGMGMGLNLCLVYLRPLGISYDIHSETGKGTEFILRIPIAQN